MKNVCAKCILPIEDSSPPLSPSTKTEARRFVVAIDNSANVCLIYISSTHFLPSCELLTIVLIFAAQRPVRVVVLRRGEQTVLSLTPQRWAGKGLLGYVDATTPLLSCVSLIPSLKNLGPGNEASPV